MALRDTRHEVLVLRQTVGNTPDPFRVTKSHLQVLRQVIGNTPKPIRVTKSHLQVLRQVIGNTPKPLRVTKSHLQVLRQVTGNIPQPFKVTSTWLTVVRMPQVPPWVVPVHVSQMHAGVIMQLGPEAPLYVTQVNAGAIIRVETVHDEHIWPIMRLRKIMGPLKTTTLTIPSGAAVSDAMKLEPSELLVGISMPSAFDGGYIGFEVTLDGITFQSAKTTSGAGVFGYVSFSVEPGRYIVMDPMKIPGIRWFKLRAMDSSGTSVTQSAPRSIRVITVKVA